MRADVTQNFACLLVFAMLCTTAAASVNEIVSNLVPVPHIAQSGQYPFDGKWVGEVKRQHGQCTGVYNFHINVSSGQISGKVWAKDGTYSATGNVTSDGTIEKFILENGGTAILKGRFDGNQAEGTWESDHPCEGTFKFSRNSEG